ncbi:MAG: TetR/AcrR family transcriptional regulator [Bacilli bacterium]|nr:TetR/AcrR family transcriptional regulator [Bacilli bacterium]
MKITNSKEYIGEAIIHLMAKRKLEDITISDICKKAGVSRSTFYRYFSSVNDLYESIIDNVAEGVIKASFILLQEDIPNEEETVKKCVCQISSSLHEYHSRIANLVPGNRARMIWDLSVSVRKSQENIEVKSQEKHFLRIAQMGAFIGILSDWANNGFKQSTEEISEIISSFILKLGKN